MAHEQRMKDEQVEVFFINKKIT